MKNTTLAAPSLILVIKKVKFISYLIKSNFRHHFQTCNEAKDAVLHREFDHPVRRHHFLDRAGLLFAVRLRRESHAMHLHSAVAHCVLLAAGRNHPADVAGRAAAGKISPIYYDPGDAFHLRHRVRPQRLLPVSTNYNLRSLSIFYEETKFCVDLISAMFFSVS